MQAAAEIAFAKSRGLDDWQPNTGGNPRHWGWIDGYLVRYAGHSVDYSRLVRAYDPDDAQLVAVTSEPPYERFWLHDPVCVADVRP